MMRSPGTARAPYTSGANCVINDGCHGPNYTENTCPITAGGSDRRLGRFSGPGDPSVSYGAKSSQDHSSDAEIIRYIHRIINSLTKPQENSKKDKIRSRGCRHSPPENRNLDLLLSLRLGEITRIKDICTTRVPGPLNSVAEAGRNEPRGRNIYFKKPVLNLSEARSDSGILILCLKSLKWKSCNYNAGDIVWFGFSLSLAQMCDFISTNRCVNRPRMSINRFPDIQESTRKGNFYQILDIYTLYIGCSDCFPRSFQLPRDLNKVLSALSKKAPLIFKPSNGSMGQGVRVVTMPEDISDDFLADYTAQEYISSPLLLGGKKFDVRLYLLIIGGFKAYLSKRALVRVCTEEYEYPAGSNTTNNFIHLTNYSINKSNVLKYHRGEVDDEMNNKRPLSAIFNRIEAMGYDTGDIWSQMVQIASVVSGTLYPEIYINSQVHSHKGIGKSPNLFQIFGMDVIVDIYGKAWLLEVNCCPSLKTNYFDGRCFREDPVDLEIKVPVITGALSILDSLQVKEQDEEIEEMEDWEKVEVARCKILENLLRLFKIAKGKRWETRTLGRHNWAAFSKQGRLIELGGLIEIIKCRLTGNSTGCVRGEREEGDEEGRVAKEADREGKEQYGGPERVKKMGRDLSNELYREVLRRDGKREEEGMCFSQFVILLGKYSQMFEKWIKGKDRDEICAIFRENGVKIPLNRISWTTNKPDNLTRAKTTVTPELLEYLNLNFNLSCVHNYQSSPFT